MENISLRSTFNEAAQLYDRARPRYPQEAFEELAGLTGIASYGRVLEIGCGTGQATVPLAESGYQIVAVELGSDLAAVARRNLAKFPNVEVVNTAYEDYELPPDPFDLVFAATAWKWMNPSVRVNKAAQALGPSGYLATVDTHHVAGGTQNFFVDSQECYRRWDSDTPTDFRLPTTAEVGFDDAELRDSQLFGQPVFRDYERDIEYSADTYLEVLQTYSGCIAMQPDARAGLLECVRKLISERYEGHIAKHYLWRLRVAKRSA